MAKEMQIHLPPGPTGSWRPTLQLIRNPRAALEGWAKQYGDPFLLNALNGPVVVTGRELTDSKPVVPKRRNVTIGPSTGVPIRVVSVRLS